MKKLLLVLFVAASFVACDSAKTTTTENNADSLKNSLENKADSLQNKVENLADSTTKTIENASDSAKNKIDSLKK